MSDFPPGWIERGQPGRDAACGGHSHETSTAQRENDHAIAVPRSAHDRPGSITNSCCWAARDTDLLELPSAGEGHEPAVGRPERRERDPAMISVPASGCASSESNARTHRRVHYPHQR